MRKNIILFALCAAMLWSLQLAAAVDASEFNTPASITNKQLAPGVAAYQFTYNNIYGGPQIISVVAVNLNDPSVELNIAVCEDKNRQTISQQAKANNALAAINFGYFNMQDPSSPAGAIKYDGVVESTFGWNIGGFFHYYPNNQVAITTSAPDFGQALAVRAAFPMLVVDGQVFDMGSSDHIPGRNPRTAIGITPANIFYMVVVDGRIAGRSTGVTCYELADFMQRLGCSHALNMDGGGSSAMWLKDLGIISYPSDNKKFDHKGERRVYDILFVRERAAK